MLKVKNAILESVIVVYLVLFFMPALYRLALPPRESSIVYFFFVFFVPLLVFLIAWLKEGLPIKFIHFLVSAIFILILSSLVSTDNIPDTLSFFHAVKIYILPFFLIFAGYFASSSISEVSLFRLSMFILSIHLIASILFYYNIIENPLYGRGYSNYSSNMILTFGYYKAFTGLTLSKFALAYQVGFMLTGFLLFCEVSYFRKWEVFLFILSAIVLLLFTYNKTMWLIVTFALLIQLRHVGQGVLRLIVKVLSFILFIGVIYYSILFIQNKLYLRDWYVFLSPKSFWSRVDLWQSLFQFDIGNFFQGVGAGYFESRKQILDSQFLYTYLELGLIPGMVYFAILFSCCQLFTKNKKASSLFILLWVVTLFLGDMLGNVYIPLIAGIWGGVSSKGGDHAPVKKAEGKQITIPSA